MSFCGCEQGEITFCPGDTSEVKVTFGGEKATLCPITYIRHDGRKLQKWLYSNDLCLRRIRAFDFKHYVCDRLERPKSAGTSTVELRFDEDDWKLYVRHENQVNSLWIHFAKEKDVPITKENRSRAYGKLKFISLLVEEKESERTEKRKNPEELALDVTKTQIKKQRTLDYFFQLTK